MTDTSAPDDDPVAAAKEQLHQNLHPSQQHQQQQQQQQQHTPLFAPAPSWSETSSFMTVVPDVQNSSSSSYAGTGTSAGSSSAAASSSISASATVAIPSYPPIPLAATNHPAGPVDQPEFSDEEELDRDSALGDDDLSATISLSESVLEYRTLHGRTYHSLRGNNIEYWGPNDDRQNESMDLSHHTFTLLLEDRLFLAPIPDDVQKVLDIGTGTGLWAIDFAEMYPSAQVTGTDLSPIQPVWIPPNCKFEIDDFTTAWTWEPSSADFIHARQLFGSVPDWLFFMQQAFHTLRPGGWIESFEISVAVNCDDGSVQPGSVLAQWGSFYAAVGERTGCSFTVVDDGIIPPLMRDVGFVNVHEHRFKCPLTGWMEDRRLREIGRFNHVAVDEGLEGYALYMFTTVLGWSVDEVLRVVNLMKKAMRSRKNHGYFWVSVVTAQKPGGPL